MAEQSPYRFGRGGPGVVEGSQLAKDLDALSDEAKRERGAEEKISSALREARSTEPEDKLAFLRRRKLEFEKLAMEMDKAKNSEAARNYRRAAAHAQLRIERLSRGEPE